MQYLFELVDLGAINKPWEIVLSHLSWIFDDKNWWYDAFIVWTQNIKMLKSIIIFGLCRMRFMLRVYAHYQDLNLYSPFSCRSHSH
jgi:hypothetical protein